jgi:F-type H+-transporting ATPase subunit delta
MSGTAMALAARRYAKAIFELGGETGQLEALTRGITDFAACYAASADLASVLDNPVVPEAQRNAILDELGQRLGTSELALNAIRLLASRRRLAALPGVARRLGELSDDQAGMVRAIVTSATALPDEYYRGLTRELEAALSRKVVIEKKQDPSLIAGVVTQIGDNTIDGSVRGRLSEIERHLLQSFQ